MADIQDLQPIPISAAAEIAKRYGYGQIIVIGRRAGHDPAPHGEHITTYGRDPDHCVAAAKIGDFLKVRVMGWPLDDRLPAPAELPWDDCKVAFGIDDDEPLDRDRADLRWRDRLPAGWSFEEADVVGARGVAIFRVERVPSPADGEAVERFLVEIGANQETARG